MEKYYNKQFEDLKHSEIKIFTIKFKDTESFGFGVTKNGTPINDYSELNFVELSLIIASLNKYCDLLTQYKEAALNVDNFIDDIQLN